MLKIILLGTLSFFILTVFDWMQLHGKKRAWVPGILGAAVFVTAVFFAVSLSPAYFLPVLVRIPGGVLCFIFAMLLVWSLFLELPFTATYVRLDCGERRLVTWGTYALCRHPGVLWLSLALIFLFMATGARWLLLAAPIWVGCAVIHVFSQEKFFFTKMFTDYREYQRRVPFLLPTGESVRVCCKTLLRAMGPQYINK